MSERQQDDFDRGLRNRRAVLGDAWVDQSLDRASAFNDEFQSLITRYAWHDIWGRPGLDVVTRRLLVLGMTMGQARWEEFELHCRAAVRGGVPLETIKETLMQGAIYCGVPAANTAFKLTLQILREEGRLPPPAPLSEGVRVVHHHTFSQPQLHAAVQGAGPGVPVVLSHALGLDLRMWDALAAELAPGRAVLRYDHRGHGGSAVPPGPYTLDAMVDDAARLLREWGRGPVVFVGLSMGGMVGQGLALRHPELLRGLVIANSTARYPEAARAAWAQRIAAVEAGGMAAIAPMVVERYLHADFRAAQPAVAEALRATLLRCDPAGYAAASAAVAGVDWLDALPALRCPTLVIAGERDVGAPPEMARAMADAIPGARLELLADASHLSVAESAWRFGELLRGFLAGIDAGSPA
ncbi:bifunctional 4-carboxymuconolactone decarboxylase/3-oxoadipate enol-lactonase PcaCD [Piscinibacter sakaiensis]|uniref:Beta-ketoadipate enol-lactone hydrolase n=1 Tax=Piscinibacter sakaiensis TaxID=1547922 RepID=A0A0K8NTP2_PISS1|nr:alpha/beta fold hydrolase [Piscinibacter sakaiensis]GAP33781.1 beta-ketoadipate enol-lactone hydrolase [Piscinibacter sakaiensis]